VPSEGSIKPFPEKQAGVVAPFHKETAAQREPLEHPLLATAEGEPCSNAGD